MTEEQLDALIEFVKEEASYRAALATDYEASRKYARDAEHGLRQAFQTTGGNDECG